MQSKTISVLLPLAVLAALGAPAAAQPTACPPGPVNQLRTYAIVDANRDAFKERFRDHAVRVMARYGFRILGMWESRTAAKTEWVYLLAWPDEATMKQAWTGFLADKEWIEIKRVTGAKHGTFVNGIEDRTLCPVAG